MRRLTFAAALLAVIAGAPRLARAEADDPSPRGGETRIARVQPKDALGRDALLRAAESLARLGPGACDALFARSLRATATLSSAMDDLGQRARAVRARPVSGRPLAASPLLAAELRRLKETGDAPASVDALLEARRIEMAGAAGLTRAPAWRAVYLEVDPDGAVPLGAFASTLLLDVRLAEDLLSVRRTETVAGGEVQAIGRTAEDGYLGLILLLDVAARLHALHRELGARPDRDELERFALERYDPFGGPRWLPHGAREEKGRLIVTERESDLGDLSRCLIAATRFARLADDAPGGPLFGRLAAGTTRAELFQPAWAAEARALARHLALNLVTFHFDPSPERRALVSRATLAERGEGLDPRDLGLALEALAGAADLLRADEPKLAQQLERVARAQVDALAAARARGAPIASVPPDLSAVGASCAVLRGLLLARGVLAGGADEPGAEARLGLLADVLTALERERFDPWVSLYLDGPSGGLLDAEDAALVLELHVLLGLHGGRAEALVRAERLAAAYERLGVLPDPETGDARRAEVELTR